MTDVDAQFVQDLQREDDVGLVLLGHLHIEHQLIELISASLPFPDRCDWGKVTYATKVALAHACGLPENLRSVLSRIGKLRNNFAHKLDAALSRDSVLAIYNGLPADHQQTIKQTYQAMGLGALASPSSLTPRDLLVLLLLNTRQAVRAAVLAVRGREW